MTKHKAPLVKAFLNPDSETFSYVVYDRLGGQAVVIDPVLGFDYASGRTRTESAQRLLDFVHEQRLIVPWILETHVHADHLSAASFLRQRLGGKTAIGERITEVQAIFRDVFELEPEFLSDGSQFDRLLADGDILEVGELHIRVMHTPGHTPVDMTYLINEQAAFVGDTLFMPDVGTARCDFPGGSASRLYQSVQCLLALPESTDIHVCHDYPKAGREHRHGTTVAEQRRHNIHVRDGIDEASFVRMRHERDDTLSMPRLLLPAIQVNIRAGKMPPADEQGKVFLKLPVNRL
ncbi:MBL fold metallo-hydrolase [Oceanisphaera sp. KMM 10153]|uniref:MBL fold metallo-hydrolase n=1 Tax=Oceanisphaera submarina TaxID=3390193 RepID=UPI0039761707